MSGGEGGKRGRFQACKTNSRLNKHLHPPRRRRRRRHLRKLPKRHPRDTLLAAARPPGARDYKSHRLLRPRRGGEVIWPLRTAPALEGGREGGGSITDPRGLPRHLLRVPLPRPGRPSQPSEGRRPGQPARSPRPHRLRARPHRGGAKPGGGSAEAQPVRQPASPATLGSCSPGEAHSARGRTRAARGTLPKAPRPARRAAPRVPAGLPLQSGSERGGETGEPFLPAARRACLGPEAPGRAALLTAAPAFAIMPRGAAAPHLRDRPGSRQRRAAAGPSLLAGAPGSAPSQEGQPLPCAPSPPGPQRPRGSRRRRPLLSSSGQVGGARGPRAPAGWHAGREGGRTAQRRPEARASRRRRRRRRRPGPGGESLPCGARSLGRCLARDQRRRCSPAPGGAQPRSSPASQPARRRADRRRGPSPAPPPGGEGRGGEGAESPRGAAGGPLGAPPRTDGLRGLSTTSRVRRAPAPPRPGCSLQKLERPIQVAAKRPCQEAPGTPP